MMRSWELCDFTLGWLETVSGIGGKVTKVAEVDELSGSCDSALAAPSSLKATTTLPTPNIFNRPTKPKAK